MPLDHSLVGKTYPASAPYQVSREKIREFAAAIGDQSPACHDVAAARAAGHDDLVAPPTFAMIVTIRAIEVLAADPDLGLDYQRMVHGDQRFAYRRPIVAGDELVLVTAIEEITNRAGNDFLTMRAEISTAGGDLVVTARALLVVRGEAA